MTIQQIVVKILHSGSNCGTNLQIDGLTDRHSLSLRPISGVAVNAISLNYANCVSKF